MDPVKASKFLSYVLRHKPESIGIDLDREGWVHVTELLAACQKHGKLISYEELEHVVESNSKQRFALSRGRIRANQGHSVPVALGLEPTLPPKHLYHGTAERFLRLIRKNGLLKQTRQHVHLSWDTETATEVGRRHGKSLVLSVDAAAMSDEGYEFFLSDNNVWLTDHVPWKFLEEL